MAKRQRPAQGSADAEVEAADGHANGFRPHKNGRAAGSHSGAAAKQPEAAARALQAADIRAPGVSSATSFAQLQVTWSMGNRLMPRVLPFLIHLAAWNSFPVAGGGDTRATVVDDTF